MKMSDLIIQIKPRSIAGHGLTGEYSWAIIFNNEHKPRMRLGYERTEQKAFNEAVKERNKLIGK